MNNGEYKSLIERDSLTYRTFILYYDIKASNDNMKSAAEIYMNEIFSVKSSLPLMYIIMTCTDTQDIITTINQYIKEKIRKEGITEDMVEYARVVDDSKNYIAMFSQLYDTLTISRRATNKEDSKSINIVLNVSQSRSGGHIKIEHYASFTNEPCLIQPDWNMTFPKFHVPSVSDNDFAITDDKLKINSMDVREALINAASYMAYTNKQALTLSEPITVEMADGKKKKILPSICYVEVPEEGGDL